MLASKDNREWGKITSWKVSRIPKKYLDPFFYLSAAITGSILLYISLAKCVPSNFLWPQHPSLYYCIFGLCFVSLAVIREAEHGNALLPFLCLGCWGEGGCIARPPKCLTWPRSIDRTAAHRKYGGLWCLAGQRNLQKQPVSLLICGFKSGAWLADRPAALPRGTGA